MATTIVGTMVTTITTRITIPAGTMVITTSNKEIEKAKQTILIPRKSLMENATIMAFKVTKKLIAIKIKEMKNTKAMEM